MRHDVKEFVSFCATCLTIKYSVEPPYGLLQPLLISQRIWDDVALDFSVGLPKCGYSIIMVVTHRLSKYTRFGTLHTSFTYAQVAKLFNSIVV